MTRNDNPTREALRRDERERNGVLTEAPSQPASLEVCYGQKNKDGAREIGSGTEEEGRAEKETWSVGGRERPALTFWWRSA